MRITSLIAASALLVFAPAAVAQEYVDFKSPADGFSIVFPVEPKVTESTFTTQNGSALPSRIIAADTKTGHYLVTVVDYTNIHQIAVEKAKACPPGAETCLGTESDVSSTGRGYWKADISGATIYATYLYLQRDAKLTFMGWETMDLVEGTLVSLTNNKDGSHTSAGIYMHQNKLYLLEATEPKNVPPPDWFAQNVGWLEPDGTPIRYLSVYHQGYPRPAMAKRRAPESGN